MKRTTAAPAPVIQQRRPYMLKSRKNSVYTAYFDRLRDAQRVADLQRPKGYECTLYEWNIRTAKYIKIEEEHTWRK